LKGTAAQYYCCSYPAAMLPLMHPSTKDRPLEVWPSKIRNAGLFYAPLPVIIDSPYNNPQRPTFFDDNDLRNSGWAFRVLSTIAKGPRWVANIGKPCCKESHYCDTCSNHSVQEIVICRGNNGDSYAGWVCNSDNHIENLPKQGLPSLSRF